MVALVDLMTTSQCSFVIATTTTPTLTIQIQMQMQMMMMMMIVVMLIAILFVNSNIDSSIAVAQFVVCVAFEMQSLAGAQRLLASQKSHCVSWCRSAAAAAAAAVTEHCCVCGAPLATLAAARIAIGKSQHTHTQSTAHNAM